MKVLSIKEPYATLIKNGYKHIETRSWKTSYRGDLYIHASGTAINKEYKNNPYILDIIKNMDMNYGHIICKVKLVDCIFMDEEFIKNVKKDTQEYNLGIYEVGRYAWILRDIEEIEKIPAKGKLNIWNYEK